MVPTLKDVTTWHTGGEQDYSPDYKKKILVPYYAVLPKLNTTKWSMI